MIRRTSVILSMLLLFPVSASGQCAGGRCLIVPRAPQVADAQTKRNNIVRIEVEERGGQSWGSGTIVDQRGKCAWVLTVQHLLRDRAGRVIVHVQGRGRWLARVVAEDVTWDLALLLIGNPGVEPARIAEAVPRPGQRLKMGGFGQGRFSWSGGTLVGFAAPGRNQPHDLLRVAGVVRQGDSGGPIATANDRIVGVITGTDGRVTVGASVVRIKQLLTGIEGQDSQTEPAPKTDLVAVPPAEPATDTLPEIIGAVVPPDCPLTPSPPHPITPSPAQPGAKPQVTAGNASAAWMVPLIVAAGSAAGVTLTPLAAYGIFWAGRLLIGRRRRRKEQAAAADGFQGEVPRDDEQARQFLRLSQLEGRSPVHDALVGRVAGDELEKTIAREPDGPQADWARRLKRTLEDRFNEMAPLATYSTIPTEED